MVRAQASGAIDFRQARPTDRGWYRRLFWTLDQVEQDAAEKLLLLKHAQYCAALSRSQTAELVTMCLEEAGKLRDDLAQALFPYQDHGPKKTESAQVHSLSRQWKDTWGDPKDPSVQKKIQATVDFLRSKGKKKKRGGSQP